jgi:acetyl esterase/lipase
MKLFFTCLTVLSFLQMTHAQDITIPLWPAGKVPNYQKSDEVEKIESTDIVRISKVQSPDIAVFLPAKKNSTGQTVIICPGGGYAYLSYNWEGSDVAKLLNAKGITAIVLKYRLPNAKSNITPNLSPLMDAKRAMRIVRANADKWGIKKNNIGVMGFSAGGHLASTLATHFDDGDKNSKDSIEQQSSRPDFAVLIYPVITMNKSFTHMGSRNNLLGNTPDSSLVNLYSNELQVTKDTPPTFLLHATDDGAVPVANSLRFYEACKANGVPVEMHIFPKGGHGFGLALGKGSLETWPDLLVAWMRGLGK